MQEKEDSKEQKLVKTCKHKERCIIHIIKGFGHSFKLGLYLRLFGILIQFLTKGPLKVLQEFKKAPL
jgi:hypothetical protein